MIRMGFHIGGGEVLTEGEVESLKGRVEAVQIFVTSPMRGDFPAMRQERKSSWKSLVSNFEVIVHSPYWVSVIDEDRVKRLAGYLTALNRYFNESGNIRFVTHVGMDKEGKNEKTQQRMRDNVSLLVKAAGGVRLFVENTSGSKGKPSVTLQDLVRLKEEVPLVGLTLDTEHAYAAGEDIDKVDLSPFEIIHLNAIPWYVRKGGHLDRHSFTKLVEGKPIINELIDKIKDLSGDRFVIMERRVADIALEDIEYVKKRWIGEFSREESKDLGSEPA